MTTYTSEDISAAGKFYGIRYDVEDPILQPYKVRAGNRLKAILNQLDLGSDASFGYIKVTWHPDANVRVRYLVMEGILHPIIVVRVEFAPGINRFDSHFMWGQQLFPHGHEEEEDDDDNRPTYHPFAWIGIHAFNHQKPFVDDNTNSEFWGFPVDPSLYALEPEATTYNHTVEAEGGAIWAGNLSFTDSLGSLISGQKFFQVHGGQDLDFNAFYIDQGTFQSETWKLSFKGLVAASDSNMLCLEHLDCFVTAPPQAFSGGLPRNYWKRSIMIPGKVGATFPDGAEDGPDSDFIDAGGGTGATTTATYSGSTITGQILSGEYEIGAFAMGWPCESTTASLQIRVVVGGQSTDGSPPDITVYDIFPTDIGQSFGKIRQRWLRTWSLGGRRPCGFFTPNHDNVGGPNDAGPGWWANSIFINVEEGTLEVRAGSRKSPFFGFGCDVATHISANDSRCSGTGCTGTVSQPANNLDVPGDYAVSFKHPKTGLETVADARDGVVWHMARVISVNSSGHICYIKLLGNDGAQGGTCTPCQAFSYGISMRAIGFKGLPSLDVEIAGRERSSFSIGELVTVIGYTDPHFGTCLVPNSDWRLIVTDPHGAGQDFTSLFWSQLRCPAGDGQGPVHFYFADVEAIYQYRLDCQGGPIVMECNCDSGQMRCAYGEEGAGAIG